MRIEHLQVQMKTQDAVISQLRSAENAARNEIQALRKTHSDEHSQRILNEQLVVEAEQKLKLAEHSAELAKKRNAELQTRCDELSGQVVSERASESVPYYVLSIPTIFFPYYIPYNTFLILPYHFNP